METTRIWHGVRTRKSWAGSDPDATPRQITLPAAWDDAAAAALAALAPGAGAVSLAEAADAWIRPIAWAAEQAGIDAGLGDRLHHLLLLRRGAPAAAIWRGAKPEAPAYVLNLAAFHDTALGFDLQAFATAIQTAATAMALAVPTARRLAIGLTDLASLLAALGLDYDCDAARDVAACLAALLRTHADIASARFGRQATLTGVDWPCPPGTTALPGLADAAREARAAVLLAPSHRATTAIATPGAPDALLGVATGGIAPAFSPVDAEGRLTRASRAWLTARGLTAEDALAAVLTGTPLWRQPDITSHAAMHAAVAPFVHQMPAHPAAQALPSGANRKRRELPARHGGYTQKITLGGHRLYLRTGEYADGSLGEVSVSLPKDASTARSLMEGLTQAISLALQHGTPLDELLDLFAGTRGGPSGAVEGDPDVARATSPMDYAMRHLAANYLGRRDIPLPDEAEVEALPHPSGRQLPLALPEIRHRRPALRVVRG